MESMLAWNEGFPFFAFSMHYLPSFRYIVFAALLIFVCHESVTKVEDALSSACYTKMPKCKTIEHIQGKRSLFQLLYLPLVCDLLFTIYKPQSCQHKTCLKTQKPISNLSPEQKYKNRKNKNHHKGCFKLQLNQCANCYMLLYLLNYIFFLFLNKV